MLRVFIGLQSGINMTIYFYSASRNAFFPDVLKSDFEKAGSWPEDVVEISDDIYREFGQLIAPEGKIMAAGEDGLPVWVDIPIDYAFKSESERQELLTEANAITADWLIDLQLGVISDENKDALILWRAYIKSVKELELSAVTDKKSYNGIVWPDKPE